MAAIILGVSLSAIIIVALIVNIIRHGIGHTGTRTGGARKSANFAMPRQFSVFTLRSIARNYDLSKEQAKMLEYVFSKDGVSNPKEVLSDVSAMDRHFKRTYNSIARKSERTANDAAVQKELYQLFSTRNAIEAAPAFLQRAAVPEIGYGTEAVLSINGKTYPLKVDTVRGEVIMVECPVNPLGQPLRFQKGNQAELNYFNNLNHGFLQRCRVLDIVTAPRKPPILQLLSQGKPKPLFKRKNRRRQVNISCEFWLITITKTGAGSRAETKMSVGNRKFVGEILDISPGGCSIRTRGLLKPGVRLKISLEDKKAKATVLGQVLRINRGSSITSFLHIKFIKASLKALNIINAVVYRYNED
ncbi:MAG: PilZ domain-containing protein [Treponema sp.]|nr:PilZ domain-containing protein [Treponema sp.]